MFPEWTIINKTLEAADKAHAQHVPAPIPQATPRILPPVPQAFPSPPKASSTSVAQPRPVIKLKVGAQSQVPSTGVEPTPAKSRKNKTKPLDSTDLPHVDAPPPPYVDDGSHDILQEVLAIERQNEKRLRSEKGKDKSSMNGGSTKRKKSGSLSEEDDILTLATPSKKEKPSPPGPSTTIGKVRIVSTPANPVPPASDAGGGRPATKDVPRISIKGKEKEIPVLVPAPLAAPVPKPKKPVQATPINDKRCREILKTIQKLPEAEIFSRPVNPDTDGCPSCVPCSDEMIPWSIDISATRYLDEIKHPMDFGTMLTKLGKNKYVTMEDFLADMELVFSNCRQFNYAGSVPVVCADIVEKAFRKEWPKAVEKKLSWTEKRGLQGVIATLVKEPVYVYVLGNGFRPNINMASARGSFVNLWTLSS